MKEKYDTASEKVFLLTKDKTSALQDNEALCAAEGKIICIHKT